MAWRTEPSSGKDASAFEAKVLELWARTRLPLTRANVIAATGAPRARADAWLDAMVRDQLLEVDSDDDGELLWVVRGATRPATGLETLDAVLRMQSLSREVGLARDTGPARDTGLARARGRLAALTGAEAGGKSVVASGLLSFFFGPLGLLYAAPLKVAVPAALGWLIAASIIPKILLVYLMGVVSPLCAIAGVLYAIAYNRAGARTPLLGGDDRPPPRLPPRGR